MKAKVERSKSAASAAPPEPTGAELAEIVRAAITAKPGLKGAELKKALPKVYQRFAAEALATARDLARTREVFRYAKGTTERFFPADPLDRLELIVKRALTEAGPLDGKALKARVRAAAPGLEDLLAEWLRGALGRAVFAWGPATGSKGKRFGHEPDLGGLLKKTLGELDRALDAMDRAGLQRARALEVLTGHIGLRATGAAPAAGEVARLREAIDGLATKQGPGSMILIRDVRARVSAADGSFDHALATLAEAGEVDLFHHDYPRGADPGEIVSLGRVPYVGLAWRRPR